MWCNSRRISFCFLVLCGLQLCVFCDITIKKLTGAEMAEFGTSVTLKCDSLVRDDTGVEVKWFYNRDTQIFSWVPNRSKPQAIGEYKSILEVNEDNSLEQDTMHSSIRFKNVTFDLSGDYMCKISGDHFEDEETKTMVVYQPASMIELDHDEYGTLSCSAYELYPQPSISIVGIYMSGSNETVSVKETGLDVTGNKDDLFNVTKTFAFDNKELEGDIEFICTVIIPNTNYNETRTVLYESSRVDVDDYDETTTEDSSANYTNDTEISWFYNETSTEDLLDNLGSNWRNPWRSWPLVSGMILISLLHNWC